MKRPLIPVLLSLLVIFVVIQFIPVAGKTNPPVTGDIAAPADVDAILRRSCYDCHSHETRWPWYNRIAPASWLVARDVAEGRRHLNFSVWDTYGSGRKADLLEEVGHEVEEGEMPLWFYVPLHPEAKLSDEDKARLRDWSRRTSGIYETKAEVEDAVSDLLEDTQRAVEDAAEELQKVTEKALKAAEDSLKKGDNSGNGSGHDDSI